MPESQSISVKEDNTAKIVVKPNRIGDYIWRCSCQMAGGARAQADALQQARNHAQVHHGGQGCNIEIR